MSSVKSCLAAAAWMCFGFAPIACAQQLPAKPVGKPRQLAEHLYAYQGSDLPTAQWVPQGAAPDFRLDQSVVWNCDETTEGKDLDRCATNYLTGQPYRIARITLRQKPADYYGERRYDLVLRDGRQFDVWQSPAYGSLLPDGSRVRGGVVEDELLEHLRTPWGSQTLRNVYFSPQLSARSLDYYQRVSATGETLWANVYLLHADGGVADQSGQEQIRNPLLGLNEICFPKGSGRAFLASSATGGPSRLRFGSVAVEIDLQTGQLLTRHPRVRAIPVDAVVQHYERALKELIAEGVIRQSGVRVVDEPWRPNKAGPYRYLDADQELSQRLARNLLRAYF